MIPEDDDFLDEENLSEDEKLKLENQIKKLKSEMNGGKIVSKGTFDGLPPEIESMFLDGILEFEEKLKNKVEITIHEKIKFHVFPNEADLTDEEIEIELENARELFMKNQLIISTMFDVDSRILYKFISEEFINMKMVDVGIKGMMSHYTYEDYHPNHHAFISEFTQFFVENFFDLSSDEYINFVTPEFEKNQTYTLFRDAYESFEVENVAVEDLEVFEDEETAVSYVSFDLIGKIENSAASHIFKDRIAFQYKKDNKTKWRIDGFQLPKAIVS
jgi:hypothetical protein